MPLALQFARQVIAGGRYGDESRSFAKRGHVGVRVVSAAEARDESQACRGPSLDSARSQAVPDAGAHRRRRLFADALRRRRRRHHRQLELTRQDRGIRRDGSPGAGRSADRHAGARARRARSGAAADSRDGPHDGGRGGRDHPAAGLLRGRRGPALLARDGAQADHAAGQADDHHRPQRGLEARALFELRSSRSRERGRAQGAAPHAGEDRLRSADAEGVRRALLAHRERPRRASPAHLAVQ